MGWFKQTINNIIYKKTSINFMRKKASVDDIKARALDALRQGIPPEHVGQQFIMQMSMEDPSFARGPSMGQIMQSMVNKESLETAISGIGSSQVMPPTGIAPNLPTTPIDIKPPIGEVKLPTDEVKPPIDEPIDQIPGDPDPEENTPFEDQEEKKNPFDEVGEEQGLQSFQDRLMEDMEEVTEIDPDAPKKKSDPQIMEPFLIPEKRVKEMHEELQVINAMLRKVHLPPIDMVPTSDDLVTRTVHYENGQQEEAFQELKMTGTLPSPTDEMTIKKIKHRTWGRKKYDPLTPKGHPDRRVLHEIGDPMYNAKGLKVKEKESTEQIGIKLIAQINHHALTDEEQAKYLATEPEGSPLRASILAARDPKANEGEILTPYYNTITSIGGQYKWQDKFYFTRGEDCYKCQVGQHRNTTYVGIIVKPDQLNQRTYPGVDGNGQEAAIGMTIRRNNPAYNPKLKDPDPEAESNQMYVEVPALEINEDALKLPYQQQVQEQIGGKCATNLDEIKVVEKLKRLIARMSLTSKEIEENNAKNVRKGEKKEEDNADLIGGTRGSTPINNYYAVLIALLRENGIDKDISGQIPRSVGTLLQLKAYQKQGPQTPEIMEKMKQLTMELPTITPEDTQLARIARSWWVKRMGSYGLSDIDKNVVNMSVPSTINVQRNEVGKSNIDNSIYMMRTFLKENEIDLDPYAEGTQTDIGQDISEEMRLEEVAPEQEILDNIGNIAEGGTFVSKFTYLNSIPYGRGDGVRHFLRGSDGKKYKIFDKFKTDPISNRLITEPKYDFNDGEEYTLRGRKGSFSRGETALGNVTIITPERLRDHVGAEEAPVDQGIDNTPVDQGIGGPPEEQASKPKVSIEDITDRAKWVVENGRDTRGNPMTVETLIPLYLNQLAIRVEGLEATKDNYVAKLNEINQRGGPPAVAKYMETLRKHFKDYEI